MKSLELDLKERLLIVEMTGELDTADVFSWNNQPVEKICEGPDLTEDIANGFAHSMNFGTDENPDIGYHHSIKDNYWCESALESFISAIESKNYHWGENPVKCPTKENYGFGENINVLDYPPEWDEECYHEDLDKWKESESRTFNPEKCLIFKLP